MEILVSRILGPVILSDSIGYIIIVVSFAGVSGHLRPTPSLKRVFWVG